MKLRLPVSFLLLALVACARTTSTSPALGTPKGTDATLGAETLGPPESGEPTMSAQPGILTPSQATNPSATPTRIPALTLPITNASQECLPIEPTLPESLLLQGSLLIGDFAERAAIGPLMRLSASGNEIVALPDLPIYWSGQVSPSAEKFLYLNSEEANLENQRLIVVTGKGETIATLPLPSLDVWFDWLDEDRLAWIHHPLQEPVTIEVVDVLSAERQVITLDLPDVWEPQFPIVPGEVGWWVVLDDQLSRAAYMRGADYQQTFVLWELGERRALWTLSNWTALMVRPAWSPDGSSLAVVSTDPRGDEPDRIELHVVNPQGDARRWVALDGYYSQSGVREVKWSPNGRYIAISPFGAGPFLLLDTLAGRLLDFCITADVRESVLWSPDSTQVIVPVWEQSSIVVDIAGETAARLTLDANFRPVAWLKDSP